MGTTGDADYLDVTETPHGLGVDSPHESCPEDGYV